MQIILKYFHDFTDRQLRQFESLEPLYREWNEKINVISRKDIDGLYERHVLHSLSIAAVLEFEPGTGILDLGTGGGFPGIPLAIFFPEVKFHLVDSIAKKLKVVEAMAGELGLTNVTTQHCRAEEIRNRKFDFVISRAVATLGELWKWSRPLLKTVREKSSDKNIQADPPSSTITQTPALICLKGGDLGREISVSGTRPRIMEIKEIFPEEFFAGKYLLFISR